MGPEDDKIADDIASVICLGAWGYDPFPFPHIAVREDFVKPLIEWMRDNQRSPVWDPGDHRGYNNPD